MNTFVSGWESAFESFQRNGLFPNVERHSVLRGTRSTARWKRALPLAEIRATLALFLSAQRITHACFGSQDDDSRGGHPWTIGAQTPWRRFRREFGCTI